MSCALAKKIKKNTDKARVASYLICYCSQAELNLYSKMTKLKRAPAK